jgi:hypothetical protein
MMKRPALAPVALAPFIIRWGARAQRQATALGAVFAMPPKGR